MSSSTFQIRLAPITSGLVRREPKILLGGDHQPSLLQYLDGWPKHWGKKSLSRVQFALDPKSLADLPADSFDLAVVETPMAVSAAEAIHELTRVARQGLIIRRR